MTPKIETPRGKVILLNNGKAELVWNTNAFQGKWYRRYTAAQKFVDSEVLRTTEPFVPLLTGTLIKAGILGTDIGSGKVSWIAPYARYLYYGKVMAGNPKKVTSKNLVFHGGKLRGAYWFERSKAVNKRAWIAGAKKIAGRG
jgi:hypothetical protein